MTVRRQRHRFGYLVLAPWIGEVSADLGREALRAHEGRRAVQGEGDAEEAPARLIQLVGARLGSDRDPWLRPPGKQPRSSPIDLRA
jgi:hypothetical protein